MSRELFKLIELGNRSRVLLSYYFWNIMFKNILGNILKTFFNMISV